MPSYTTQKIVNKSMYWWRHGKHKPLPDNVINPPKRKRLVRWYSSIRELFDDRKS